MTHPFGFDYLSPVIKTVDYNAAEADRVVIMNKATPVTLTPCGTKT